MQLLPPLLFGISASLDALLVGIGYGLRKVRIRAWQNLVISLVALLGTCLSACLGNRLLPFLPLSLAGCIGSIILMLLGVYYIIKWIFTRLMNCRSRSEDEISKCEMSLIPIGLSPWETLILSLTLSMNNIGIGLSASMAGLPLLPAAVMTFGCSALFLLCGNRLGQSRFLRLIGNAADPISGLLLIGLGIMQLTL